MSSRELQWNISGKDITVRIGDGTFQIADQTITYQRIDANTLDISGRRVRFHVVRDGRRGLASRRRPAAPTAVCAPHLPSPTRHDAASRRDRGGSHR